MKHDLGKPAVMGMLLLICSHAPSVQSAPPESGVYGAGASRGSGDVAVYDIAPCGGDGIVEVGDVLAILAAYTGVYACSCPGSGGWELNGNAGTSDSSDFIGTTDNMSFNVRVNNQRVMRFEPDAIAPNVIGGFAANAAALGVSGATICGGGKEGLANLATGDHSTIGGGHSNEARLRSTIGGGHDNLASGTNSTISGGEHNTSSGYAGAIGGGAFNMASGGWSTIGGGNANTATAHTATVGGGNFNDATADQATVGGGSGNTASGQRSTLGGGQLNTASGNASTVSGGSSNTASGVASTVCGGLNNAAGGDYSFAAGRQAKVRDSTQGGGFFGDEGTFVWADSLTADFVSTGANQFLIRASGGVGIGTNAPGDQLDVINALRVTREGVTSQFVQLNSAGAGGHFLYGYSGGSNRKFLGIGSLHNGAGTPGGSTGIAFYVGNQAAPLEVLRITENGRVGIGDTAPSVALDVVGDIHYTGTITDVSDERLKENIAPVEGALDKLHGLRGVYFTMKGAPDQREVGLIAQDVQKVLPEAVRVVDEDAGYLGVSYPSLVPLLVEAIKELDELRSQNEREISELTQRERVNSRRIRALEERLEKLETLLIKQEAQAGAK